MITQKGNTLILITAIIAVAAIGAFLIFQNKNSNIPVKTASRTILQTNPPASSNAFLPESTPKTYFSKTMKISLNVPPKFTLLDQSTRILLNVNNDVIVISREGTQFADLNSYLNDLDKKNQLVVLIQTQKDLTIDNYPVKVRVFTYGNNKQQTKSYDIFVDTRVYSLSTSSQSLYNDLDKIAQSFKYIP